MDTTASRSCRKSTFQRFQMCTLLLTCSSHGDFTQLYLTSAKNPFCISLLLCHVASFPLSFLPEYWLTNSTPQVKPSAPAPTNQCQRNIPILHDISIHVQPINPNDIQNLILNLFMTINNQYINPERSQAFISILVGCCWSVLLAHGALHRCRVA